MTDQSCVRADIDPSVPNIARDNRMFVRRVAAWVAGQGSAR